MTILSKILIGFVAFIHIYIVWLEMFAWTTHAKKVFRKVPADLFEKTKQMATNQGLYNGFLVAGLIWSLLIADVYWSFYVALFFLSCVFIAGIFGAITIQKSIFYTQSVPAILAIISIHFMK